MDECRLPYFNIIDSLKSKLEKLTLDNLDLNNAINRGLELI